MQGKGRSSHAIDVFILPVLHIWSQSLLFVVCHVEVNLGNPVLADLTIVGASIGPCAVLRGVISNSDNIIFL